MHNFKTKKEFLKRKNPIRLRNDGGICYLNSIINCLLNSYPFYSFTKLHLDSCLNKTCLITSLHLLFHLESVKTTATNFYKILQSKLKITKGKWPDDCLNEILIAIQDQPCFDKQCLPINLGHEKKFKYSLFGDQLCLTKEFIEDLGDKVDEVYRFDSTEYKLESIIRIILFDSKDKTKISGLKGDMWMNKGGIKSHVVSYVKISDCWFKCNDLKVFVTDFQNIQNKFGNYMFFYRK